ncbi:MAG: MBL fold metallo-hydrolase, partial [Tannerella sp.]|nr:MBL fold metallo-hydrolase [Tannerella sp.]
THYHGDHVDLFPYVPERVKQYIGRTAKEIMLLKCRYLSRKYTAEDICLLEQFNSFAAKDRIEIGDITVTPYFVSHSACDAYMFVVEGEGKRILHTGDFREHGFLGKGLIPAIETYVLKNNIDVLIIEGTMLSRMDENVPHEWDIYRRAKELMQQYRYIFVMCSSTDIDRLAAFHLAGKHTQRSFLCDEYQKEILQIFTSTAGADLHRFDNVYFYKHGHQAQLSLIKDRGFCMPVRSGYRQRRQIRDLLAQLPPEQTCLIYSLWDGYLNEGENQIKNYVEVWDMFKNRVKLHTSGHAAWKTLAEVCNRINPSTAIIPIHRDASTDFAALPITEELKEKIVTKSIMKKNINIRI